MSKSNPEHQPFDLEKLKQLIEMMEEHDVTEVNLRHGEEQWRLKRGSSELIHYAPPPAPLHAAPPIPVGVPAGNETAAPVDLGPTINAPTVGTFYTSASPDDPPFVVKGAKVTPETTVCLIEAMKVFNPIQAEVSGTITEILVENGAAVEFGQPLYRYQPG
ncbi:MAG TPA: acetyl-CoA carboxylase biotin carboxyl carrier protein [Planctomycetaceae bacterium]|nr:acetyl-CoA carboxylase biotin carboxyl carrier protein [Planctomycetaceae bacterium]